MKYLALLVPLFLFAACAQDTPTEPINNNKVIEQFVVIAPDGTHTVFDNEPEAFDLINVIESEADPDGWLGGQEEWGQQSECWHRTFESGTWWYRHCGYTLSEECWYFSSPTGELVDCDTLTGGGPGGDW